MRPSLTILFKMIAWGWGWDALGDLDWWQSQFYTYTRRRQWHPTPVLLPRKSYGQRSLVGCSPWGFEESDTTERLRFHFSLSCIGEGNGNPLQSSCLENPRDRGAWWAAVCGIAQSRTWLKWLSSNSSKAASWLWTDRTRENLQERVW